MRRERTVRYGIAARFFEVLLTQYRISRGPPDEISLELKTLVIIHFDCSSLIVFVQSSVRRFSAVTSLLSMAKWWERGATRGRNRRKALQILPLLP